MRYLNLGGTGLRGSRLCLGMMGFGRHESRRWALDEAAAEQLALSGEEIARLEEPYVPHPVSGIDLQLGRES